MISLGVGGTDILNQQARAAADFRLEYRSGLSLLPFFEDYFKVKPWAGVETTSRQSIWGGAGILLDIPLGQHWVLTPNIGSAPMAAATARTWAPCSRSAPPSRAATCSTTAARLVASFGHMSNAGVTKHNPGTESGVISFQIPLSSLVGH